MKRNLKKYVVVLLTFILIFLNVSSLFCCTVSASGAIEGLEIAHEINDMKNKLNGDDVSPEDTNILNKTILGQLGLILEEQWNKWMELYRGYSTGGHSFEGTDDEVAEQVAQFIVDNSQVDSNNISVTINQDLGDFIKYLGNGIINDCGYKYYYSYKIQDSLNSSVFNDGHLYNALRQKLNDLSSTGWCFYAPPTHKLWYLPFDDDLALVMVDNWGTYGFVSLYSFTSWEVSDQTFTEFTYDSNTKTYDEGVSSNVVGTRMDVQRNPGGVISTSNYRFMVTSTGYQKLLVFDNLAALKKYSQGIKPYYTSDKWSTFMNNSGNYTVDSSNSNNITYGDITNYVNNYYGNNGQYPPEPVINVYITNNIPNPDPGGSGGGGSGGGGSGGGGSGGSSTGIFDFLSKIGEVLGNLIANLGNVLAELISGISEVISSVFEVVPNILTPLMHYVFGFLPDAIQSVIYLGIVCMLLLGVIQFLKR